MSVCLCQCVCVSVCVVCGVRVRGVCVWCVCVCVCGVCMCFSLSAGVCVYLSVTGFLYDAFTRMKHCGTFGGGTKLSISKCLKFCH